jgi:glycyl-tRNA synthetase
MAESIKRKAAKQGSLSELKLLPYDELSTEQQQLVPSPATGKPGSLTPPREFQYDVRDSCGSIERWFIQMLLAS